MSKPWESPGFSRGGAVKPNAWSRSTAEEVIAALWAIAAILCFGFDFTFAGWAFAAKALIDGVCAAIYGVKEALKTK